MHRTAIHQLQIDLTVARATVETQDQLAAKIQALMTQAPSSVAQTPSADGR
ncbi:MAG TPA: hypothetical protein PLT48_01775 [Nitrospira sp.]|jgi:hypothetical protein|nr:hypothetical protein [Nitrospira sp.]HNB23613.1 hypothetical protein [Candidatus Melainabacteria bacterium]